MISEGSIYLLQKREGAVALTTEKSWSGSLIFAVWGVKSGKNF
jgi:hypothetical protein